MKSKLFFFLTLFYCTITKGAKSIPPNSPIHEVFADSTSASITTTSSSTTPPHDNYLDNISIQDVLSSDIDANEKIEKKIINAVTEYSSNCSTYRKIHLSTEGFSFKENFVTVPLDEAKANAMFHYIRVSDSSPNDERHLYSTLIGCDSSGMAKIEVKLPKNVTISAKLIIYKSTNPTNGSQPIVDAGSVSFTLKQSTLSKLFSIQFNNSADNRDSITSKILYTKSEVSLNIDTEFQMAIYEKLDAWFDEVESSIRQYLIEKLETELKNNGISVADSCSKFLTPEKNAKKINSPLFNNNFNNLYVIPNVKLETWKGVHLSAGPIVLDGLSSFNSTELIVLESELFPPDGDHGYYLTIPSPDEPEINATTIRIKTNDLKGKVDWSYNSKQKSFTFALEFIQFEVKRNIGFTYTLQNDDHSHHSHHYYPSEMYYVKSSQSKVDVNVYLGNLQIKSSKSSVCENENEFVHFVLSEYLKTAIADSLKNSLSKKLLNDSLFVNCF